MRRCHLSSLQRRLSEAAGVRHEGPGGQVVEFPQGIQKQFFAAVLGSCGVSCSQSTTCRESDQVEGGRRPEGTWVGGGSSGLSRAGL